MDLVPEVGNLFLGFWVETGNSCGGFKRVGFW